MNVKITTLQPGMISVYCQDVACNQRLVITRRDSRHRHISLDRWQSNHWHTGTTVGEYPSQAVALVQAGAWFERLRLATRTPDDR